MTRDKRRKSENPKAKPRRTGTTKRRAKPNAKVTAAIKSGARTKRGVRSSRKLEPERELETEALPTEPTPPVEWDAGHFVKLVLNQIDPGPPVGESALRSGLPSSGLFHTSDGETWIRIPVKGHVECLALYSEAFARLLEYAYFKNLGRGPKASLVRKTIDLLDGIARYSAPEYPVHARVAGDQGRILIDLGDDAWRCIEVSAEGWRLLDHQPVAFRRTARMLPLPMPTPGNMSLLRELHPALVDEDRWALVASWIVGCLRPWGPYTLLSFVGEAGSGKTGLAEMCMSLVDPSVGSLRSPPRNERDVAAAARGARVLGFDNFSRIPHWLSDCFCRVATGVAFSSREIFTDGDEDCFVARQPVLLTSIPEVVTAEDLRDRALVVTLDQLPENLRKTESSIRTTWNDDLRGAVLGGILDTMVTGMRRLPGVKPGVRIRMLDHLEWALACAPGIGVSEDTILRAHVAARNDASADAVMDSPVGKGVLALMREQSRWEGTATDLIDAVAARITEQHRRGPTWPRSPRAMGEQIRRLAPDLRRMGIEVVAGERAGHERRRMIKLTAKSGDNSPHRPHSPQEDDQALKPDYGVGMGEN